MRCMKTRSSQRPNLRPTSGMRATSTKPARACSRIEALLPPSMPASSTCLPSAAAAEIAECPVAENVWAFGGDENGIAECAAGLHPGQPVGFAIRLLRPDRSRVGDHFVIDHRDRRDVLLRGRPDRHRQLRKLSSLKVSGCPLYKTICQ